MRPPNGQCTQSVTIRERGTFPDGRQRPLGQRQSAGGHNDLQPQLQQVNYNNATDNSDDGDGDNADANTNE